MNTVFILFFLDDEYGHMDFYGVFSSRESLDSGIKKLQANADTRNMSIYGKTFGNVEVLDYFKELARVKAENMVLCGESYYFMEVNLDDPLAIHSRF